MQGANVYHRDIEGSTPLIWAAVDKHVDAVWILVEHSALIKLKNQESLPIRPAHQHEGVYGVLEVDVLKRARPAGLRPTVPLRSVTGLQSSGN